MTTNHHSNWSRREVLQATLATGLSLNESLLADDAPRERRVTKPIPDNGEQLPVVGLGTSFHASLAYEEVLALIKRMFELGGTVIDTAAYYGSEPAIGRALEELGLRKKAFISTKFNSRNFNFGASDTIFEQESFERSLQDLRTSYIDLLEVHKPQGTEELMPVMQQYKKAGKIRYFGTTTWLEQEHTMLIDFMRKYPLDFIQIDYSISNRKAAADVFPLALQRKIAVMVNVPLGGVGGSLMNAIGNRKLPSWAADFDAHSWSQFFLKYVISHPAVTCVIPGATKLDHLEDNQRAAFGRLPNAAMRKRMEEFWDNKA